MHVFAFESLTTLIAFYALLAVKVFAFVDAASRRKDAFVAADKMTKPAWLLILGLTVVVALVLDQRPLGILSIIGTVAAFVYVLDARPALVSVTRRR
ncbi:hypothetical protein GCM10027596_22640 [Nocardioides korecus]